MTDQKLPAKLPQDRFVRDIMSQALAAQIKVPENYAIENAVKFAFLKCVEENYFNKCTQDSIITATMAMVVQGLNPAKDQCYFIAYGDRLKCMRSWYGSIAVAKRYDPRIDQINYAVIYHGDKFSVRVEKGIRYAAGHEQEWTNVRADNIQGAYAVALDAAGNEIASDIMTFEEIKESWKRSSKKTETKPFLQNGELNPNSDHGRHPDRFACRTVVNRLCKALISVTDDKCLMLSYQKTDEDISDAEVIETEIDEQANSIPLDFPPREQDPEPEQIEFVPATDEQCTRVFELINEPDKAKLFEIISREIGRQIDGLKQMSSDEAEKFILAHEPPQNEPDWK